jgi:hypothetical protein
LGKSAGEKISPSEKVVNLARFSAASYGSRRVDVSVGTPSQSHWDNNLELVGATVDSRDDSKNELSITLGAELLEVHSVGS